jgi:hypothetical protein
MNPVVAFEALGHDTRLAVFRLLIPAGPDGLAAGQISERMGMPPTRCRSICLGSFRRISSPRGGQAGRFSTQWSTSD